MRRLAFVAEVEFALPPIEELERPHGVGDFVAEVVGPAAVSVYVIEMLVKRFWKKPGDDLEVFVVMRGEPVGVFLRNGGSAAGWRCVAHDFEFARSQHLKKQIPRSSRNDIKLNASPS